MREIRPYGSVRGVRSDPYPYRDEPYSDAEGSVSSDAARPPRRTARWLGFRERLLLHLLHERERPDEQDYLSGLWRSCNFAAYVCRRISVVKNFFRAEVL